MWGSSCIVHTTHTPQNRNGSQNVIGLAEETRNYITTVLYYLNPELVQLKMNDESFRAAIWMNDIAEVARFLDAGQDVNAEFNPLFYAINSQRNPLVRRKDAGDPRHDRLPMIELLINRNAQIETPGRSCPDIDSTNSPLWMASIGQHVEIVKLLISRGVDVLRRDNHGRTTLDSVQIKLNRRLQDDLVLRGLVRPRLENVYEIEAILKHSMNHARNEINRTRNTALAMGHHDRVGLSSPLYGIDIEVLRMIAGYAADIQD